MDKTLLIREVLLNNKTSMIAAPPKFGKSTNLDMIKVFFEIEVDENGRAKTRSNYSLQPVRDTDNFRLFDDNSFKISQESILVHEYLGRTPVLSVSFRCDRELKGLEDVINYFKFLVHQTFKQYRYLIKSEKLASGNRQYIESWCSESEYHMFGKQRVSSALRELAEYLYRHFDRRRVFVLIDDHDSVIKWAMHSVSDDDTLDDIVRFSVCIMNALLKSNSRYVQGGLITGVSDIPAFGSPAHNIDDPDSFQIYRFLDDHRFVEFYGLTSEEVEQLFVYPKQKLGEHVEDRAADMYGGYLSVSGKDVFNLFSVLKLLESGEFKIYWPNCCPILNVNEMVKISYLNECLTKLLKGDSINVTVIKEVKPDDIALHRDFIFFGNSPKVQEAQKTYLSKEYIFFLVEKGFLTYDSGPINVDDETRISVRIPNKEIKQYFTEVLQ